MDQNKTSTEETLFWISEVFKEMALEKKALREREDKQYSKREKFWKWLTVNGSSLTVIVTVLSVLVGGVWTAQTYFAQRRAQIEADQKAAELNKQTLIAQFAGDLGDKDKRNGAALALAVLAKEAAIPILESHLRDTVSEDEADKRFRSSLVQAFISIGPGSLLRLIAINKELSKGYEPVPQREGVYDVTQRVIVNSLKNDREYLVANNISFAGTSFRNVDLPIAMDHLNFSGAYFVDSNFCGASFKQADLKGANFYGHIQLGNSDMDGAHLDNAYFSGKSVILSGVKLNQARGVKVNFSSCQLDSAELKDAFLNNSDFSETFLRGTDFSSSQLNNGDFTHAELYKAKFVNADLTGANMMSADLEGVDFSGANLAGVKFYPFASEMPVTPGGPKFYKGGAFVRGANFSNAKNLDNETRMYLCKWGAVNVPGGCEGIAQAEITFKRPDSGMSSGSCW